MNLGTYCRKMQSSASHFETLLCIFLQYVLKFINYPPKLYGTNTAMT